MGEGDNPKKEWDETPPWIGELMRMLERQIAKTVPQSPITFVIQRDELLAHLSERATHYITEATLYRTGEKTVELPDPYDFPMYGETKVPEVTPAELEAARARMRDAAAEGLVGRAKTFRFMASHLAKIEAFTIEMQTAQWLDLVPQEVYQAIMPRRPPRPVVGSGAVIPTL